MKLRALEKYMDENGIAIDFDGYHLNVIDTESNSSARYVESETGEDVSQFPYLTETKLTIQH